MTKRLADVRKNNQVWWSDVEPWLEQLYTDHKVYVRVAVYMFAEKLQMRPTVEVVGFRVTKGRQEEQVYRKDTQFDWRATGGAEAMVVRAVSEMLLILENEKAEAERQQGLWA